MKSLPKRVQSPFSTVWEVSRSLGQFLGDRPVFSAILALGVAALALWLIPMWQAAIVGLQGQAGLELENQLRQTLAQILAGAFVLAGLYLGWRRVVVAQEGQFTERFTRAVDQVGSEKLEIRLGGIYALERLAKDSADKDHWTIMEVLTAFVREQSSRSQVSGQPSNDLKVSSHKKNSPSFPKLAWRKGRFICHLDLDLFFPSSISFRSILGWASFLFDTVRVGLPRLAFLEEEVYTGKMVAPSHTAKPICS